MFILAREGATYARIRFNVGPSADVELSTEIDFAHQFDRCDHESWRNEYDENVATVLLGRPSTPIRQLQREQPTLAPPDDWYDPWFEYLDDDFAMEKRDEFKT
jgi:hypothetical protein